MSTRNTELFEVGQLVGWHGGYDDSALMMRDRGPGPFRVSFVAPAASHCMHKNAPHMDDMSRCNNSIGPSHPQSVSIEDPETGRFKGVLSGSHLTPYKG